MEVSPQPGAWRAVQQQPNLSQKCWSHHDRPAWPHGLQPLAARHALVSKYELCPARETTRHLISASRLFCQTAPKAVREQELAVLQKVKPKISQARSCSSSRSPAVVGAGCDAQP